MVIEEDVSLLKEAGDVPRDETLDGKLCDSLVELMSKE